jgi:hypothetical protein
MKPRQGLTLSCFTKGKSIQAFCWANAAKGSVNKMEKKLRWRKNFLMAKSLAGQLALLQNIFFRVF